jgi:hypothetical protein
MSPHHPPSSRSRGPFIRTITRLGTVAGVAALAVMSPLAVNAAEHPDSDPPVGEISAAATQPASIGEALEVARAEAARAAQLELEALLLHPFSWDERSLRVAALQIALGVTVDGWYAWQTHGARVAAMAWTGLPVEGLPATPPPPPPPARSSTTRSGGGSGGGWAALRQCESNGNYSAVNSSGRYRGAYQFDQPTWNEVAGRRFPHLVGVDPAAASPSDQDAMARALYDMRGAGPWPVCGRHLR